MTHTQSGFSIIPRDATGAALRVEIAERVPTWSDRALGFIACMVLVKRDFEFTCEEVRKMADFAGFLPPPDTRAWGNVLLRAADAKLIRPIGYRPASNPRRHGGITRVWVTTR